jgi:hypothetical protein
MAKHYLVGILILFCYILFFVPGKVFAAESIQRFDVNLIARQNGEMSIEEVIRYDFDNNSRHGIFRTIPLVTPVGESLERVMSLSVTAVRMDGQQEPFDVNSNDQTVQIKIGDPDQTITGLHTYTIDYSVQNGIASNYSDHDEIYWNVTGNQWPIPIAEASVTLKTDFGVQPGNTICYTGVLGSRASNCSITDVAGGKLIVTTKPLSINEGLTVVTAFPVGTFPKSTLQKVEKPTSFSDVLRELMPIYAILNFLLAPGLLYWYLRHKRKQRLGPPVVNFDIPNDAKGERISPAEAGTIDNARLDKDDITATIFDLAIRKYIRIEQIEKKKSLVNWIGGTDYRLVKLKSFTDLNKFEKRLTSAVFGGEEEILLSEMKLQYDDFDDLQTDNFTSLMNKKLYTKNPQGQMGMLLVLGIMSCITLNLFLGPVLIFLSRKLNGRTQLGDEIDWKIDGLKLFLKNMNRYYKWQAEKAYTVEQMIPYAMALGYIDAYMKQVKILNPEYEPTWYRGNMAFWMFAPGFHSSFNNAVITSAPQSASGFSSGGFSGGGGGGGGGGSW